MATIAAFLLRVVAGCGASVGVAVAALAAAAPAPTLAQEAAAPALPRAGATPQRQSERQQLDFLFGALKAAPDAESAKHVEARIVAVWMRTPSDTAALLMSRARQAMEAGNAEVALKLFDAIVKLRPDYVEAWNKRATLYYMRDDYARSLADIREVLAREPRHFGALAGLGMIMRDIGDDRKALAAFRQALALHPHLGNIPDLVKALSEKVEGRDI
jgi:tetratricopeptide (TPR) repeat protein